MSNNSNAVQMDTISKSGNSMSGSGDVAQRLMEANFNVSALRTQDVLRKDEWVNFDSAILAVATTRLVGVADLFQAGLVYNVENALGVTKVEWEKVSEVTGADVSMSGLTSSENDRVTFDLDSVPLPIIHKDFQINARALQASRNSGQSLDTTQAELASRMVSEKVESLLFSGSNVAGAANKIYGYQTAPNRNTGSLTASWTSATGAQILADILSMISAAEDDNMYGPFMVYVPNAAYIHMADDYKAESDKTILERIKAIPSIIDVRPSTNLAATEAVLVQMTRDVVDMIDGISPQMIQWSSHGGMQLNFKVLAIMVPRIKSDANSQSGIIHFSV